MRRGGGGDSDDDEVVRGVEAWWLARRGGSEEMGMWSAVAAGGGKGKTARGREKAHLLEDKQIPCVGVFDEVSFYTLFQAFGKHFEEKHVTSARFGKKQGENTTLGLSVRGDGVRISRDAVRSEQQ
ncbi:hypothetical protein Tco_0245292 [Tanacetum coccineum]